MASAVWAIVSVAWFLPRALRCDEPLSDPKRHDGTPARRSMIQHRLAGVVERDLPALPNLTALADELLVATRRLWGERPLPLAPAFR